MMIRNYITKLENHTIHTYGFEHPLTLKVFRYTDKLRKIFGIAY